MTAGNIACALAQKSKGALRNCIVDVTDVAVSPSSADVKLAESKRPATTARRIQAIPLSTVVELAKPSALAMLEGRPASILALSPKGTPPPSSLAKITSILLEWKTVSTVALIRPDAVNSRREQQRDADVDERRLESRLLAFDKLLDADVEEKLNIPAKKFPDLEKLREDGKQFELKVNEFYGKKTIKFAYSPELVSGLFQLSISSYVNLKCDRANCR